MCRGGACKKDSTFLSTYLTDPAFRKSCDLKGDMLIDNLIRELRRDRARRDSGELATMLSARTKTRK